MLKSCFYISGEHSEIFDVLDHFLAVEAFESPLSHDRPPHVHFFRQNGDRVYEPSISGLHPAGGLGIIL